MSYDKGTTTKRTPRQLAKIIKAILQTPPRRARRNRATGTLEHGRETIGEPNRAHRRKYGEGRTMGHSQGHRPSWDLTMRARGERRRQRAHRRRMARR